MMNRYFSIANIVLITAGVYLCVSAFYTIITAGLDYGPVAVKSTAGPEPTPEEKGLAPRSAYQAITDRNLFNTGTEAADPKPAKMDIESLKQTEMKLKLWGTVSGEGRRAYAVIEDTKAREQNLYRIGDSIQSATVKLILRQKVILRVNNQDEILAMEEPSSTRGRPARRVASRTSGGSSAPRVPVSSYPRKISLRKDQIQKALENLPQLMEQATIRPHIEDGQPGGISITGIKPNAIFRQMRLRNGDVITGVNGSSIESVEDAMKIFEDISSGSNFQIEIKRRGRAQTIDYNIR